MEVKMTMTQFKRLEKEEKELHKIKEIVRSLKKYCEIKYFEELGTMGYTHNSALVIHKKIEFENTIKELIRKCEI